MACKYQLSGSDKFISQSEFKAYLANGGLETLYPGVDFDYNYAAQSPEVAESTKQSDNQITTDQPLFSIDDIPYSVAERAYSGISFSPDKRAKSEQESYVAHMQSVYDSVIKYANTDEQKDIINAAFVTYKDGYLKRVLAHLSAKSRVLSPMISGPANFPVRRNEKANNAEHKRLTELLDFDKYGQEKLKKIALGSRPIEDIKNERLDKIIKNISSSLETIKNIDNGTERGYSRQLFVSSITGLVKRFAKNGEKEIVNKVLDFIQDYQKDLSKPLITEKNAIWSLRDAVESPTVEEKESGVVILKTYSGATIVNNRDLERVQILFDGKPEERIRSVLKQNAFKWSPNNQAWQRQNTPNGIAAAKRVLDELFEESTSDTQYSKSSNAVIDPYTESTLTKAMRGVMDGKFGTGWTDRLLGTGKFKIVSSQEAAKIDQDAATSQGFYDPETDISYLVHDNISKKDDIYGLMLHEIGTHALQLGKDTKEFQSILKQLENMRKIGHKDVVAAFKRVPEGTKPEHVTEEALAYLVQNHANLSVVKRFVAWFKNQLRKLGVGGSWVNSLDTADLVSMANAALRSAPDSLVFDNAGETGTTVKSSSKAESLPPTITIDGKERPTTNSNGVQIAPTREGVENFWKWFGESKVVDEYGQPLVVYHGTKSDFNVFEKGDIGFHFGTEQQANDIINRLKFRDGEERIIQAYLKANNLARLKDIGFGTPNQTLNHLLDSGYINKEQARNIRDEMSIAYIDTGKLDSKQETLRNELLKLGIDGIIYDNTGESSGDSYIVFNPNQIKSATSNTGAFSPSNNDIRYSRTNISTPTDGNQGEINTGRSQYINTINDLNSALDNRFVPQKKENWQDKIVEWFVDSTRPFDAWARELPDHITAARLVMAKDLALGKRNAFEKHAIDTYGKPIAKGLAEIADKYKLDFNTAKEFSGQWATMRYIPIANANLLARYKQQALEAFNILEEAKNNPDPDYSPYDWQQHLYELAGKSQKADKDLVDFYNAMNEPRFRDPKQEANAIPLAGGLNNYTAERIKAKIESVITDKSLLDKVAQHVYDMNDWKLEQDVQSGKVSQEAADQFDKSGLYVPLTGDPRYDDSTEDFGNVGNVNQAKDKRLQGRRQSLAQDGITASLEQIGKSARFHGWQSFKEKLHGIYEDLLRDKMEEGLSATEAAEAIKQEYDITRKPENLAKGVRPSDNNIIVRIGDKTWVYDINNDAAIEALKHANKESVTKLLSVIPDLTRLYAKSVTQWSVSFAPVNFSRDLPERTFNLAHRQIAGYEDVNMDKVAARALSIGTVSFASTFKNLLPVISNGKVFNDIANNPDARLLQEMIDTGGLSTWATSLSPNKDEMIKQLKGLNNPLRKADAALSAYNNAFDVVAPFAVYKALRENGIDKEAAAHTTLNLMNFNKSGSLMPLVKACYIFAQPAATGAHQLAITLSTPKGRTRVLGMVVAASAIYALLSASAGDDDETGVNKMDNLSSYTLERNIVFFVSKDKYIKIPVGFGASQLAWATGMNFVRYSNGSQNATETLGEISKQWIKAMAPIQPADQPVTDHFATFFFQTMTPTIFKGMMNVGLDVDTFGHKLTPKFTRDDTPKALQSRQSTPDLYKDAALFLSKNGIDMHPEQLRELVRTTFGGLPNTLLQEFIENPKREADGKPVVSQAVSRFMGVVGDKDYQMKVAFRQLDELNELSRKAKLSDIETNGRLVTLQEYEKLSHSANGSRAAATKARNKGNEGAAKLYDSQAKTKDEQANKLLIEDFKKYH